MANMWEQMAIKKTPMFLVSRRVVMDFLEMDGEYPLVAKAENNTSGLFEIVLLSA